MKYHIGDTVKYMGDIRTPGDLDGIIIAYSFGPVLGNKEPVDKYLVQTERGGPQWVLGDMLMVVKEAEK
jgi:hypothetical protein